MDTNNERITRLYEEALSAMKQYDGTYAIRTPQYCIEYEDENGDQQSRFHSHDLGYISKVLIDHFGIRSVKEDEE